MRLLSSLLLVLTGAGLCAQEPRVVRKPVAVYLAEKSEGPEQGIFKADLSPDGKLLALVRLNGKLTVYAVGEKKPLFTTEPTEPRGSTYTPGVAFSADGELLALPINGKRIDILKARKGTLHVSLELPGQKFEVVDAMAFSPDGRRLAVSSGVLYHKNLNLFDTGTGKLLGQPLKDVDGIASQLQFSADGKRLVANHWNTLYLVDPVGQQLIRKIPAKASSVFFQGDKLHAVEQETSAIQVVGEKEVEKKSTGQFVEKLDPVSSMRLVLATASPVAAIPQKAEVSIRNVAGRELFRVPGEDSPIRRLCLSADGRVLMVYRDSLRVELFRLE